MFALSIGHLAQFKTIQPFSYTYNLEKYAENRIFNIDYLKTKSMNTHTSGQDLLITLNNFQMSYDDLGEGSTPIIFLHGFPFNKSMWSEQVDFLLASHRLISCDIRGFGKSEYAEEQMTIGMFADDLIFFMDKLEIKKAVICGFSMGGYIALNAIQRFPSRFSALVLCDTQCLADTPVLKEKRYATIDQISANGSEKFNDDFIQSIFSKESLIQKLELVEHVRAVMNTNTTHMLSQGLIALAERVEHCSCLNEIDVPTMIVCGREDKITPLAQSEYMHKAIQRSKLYVLEDAGHMSILEQAENFNQHLLSFLLEFDRFNFEKINGEERMN